MTTGVHLKDGAVLWRVLVSQAGLQPGSYDDDLVRDVQETIAPGSNGPIEEVLARNGVSAQTVVDAVLASLRPFAGMLTDLLALYARAGATSAKGDNLRVEYDFEPDSPPLAFDLASFRETVHRWMEVTAPVPVLRATTSQLWELEAALRPNRIRLPELPVAASLFQMYRAGTAWPARLPPVPTTGHAEVDAALGQAFEVAQSVLEVTREHSGSLADLRDIRISAEYAEGPLTPAPLAPSEALAPLHWLHSDLWLATVVNDAYHLAAQVRSGQASPGLAAGVTEAVDRLPRREELRKRRITELLDLLSLPVWGRRHELYSAWLLTLIVDAIGPDRVTLHMSEGRLAFSFAGTHVASVDSTSGVLELWAELRHPYDTPIGEGRVSGIQPDYTLSKPPVQRDESAVLVVEAKQYKRASRKRFLDALTDYVGGHTHARVLLANYGPMPASVVIAAPDRAVPLGAVRPGSPEPCKEFVATIRAAVPPPPPAPASPSPAAPAVAPPAAVPQSLTAAMTAGVRAAVALEWRRGRDLDLHLVEDGDRVTCYKTIPAQSSQDAVRLWNDDTSAPGLEIAQLNDSAGAVSLWVNRFSGDTPMPACGAAVRIRYPDGRETAVVCPAGVGPAPWWFVGILTPDGRLHVTGTGHAALDRNGHSPAPRPVH